MAGDPQERARSDAWKVMPLSLEYRRLAPEIRQEIEEYLTEHPVKLGAMAKRLGIKVLLSTLPNGTSGQIIQENGNFVIRISRHEAKHRQRYTLAHEIAHCLLHSNRIDAEGGWSENVLLRSGQPAYIEYEANRLASDLVMPSRQLADVTNEHSGPMTDEIIKDMARKFGVSNVAMEIRLQISR